ncbi:alpha-xenorhabdolysin family binary toxin subunit B [Pseudomonas sp. NUPR-001]|uniref:alpha-xenorhabdolysin family binary toxin subunit B n=1 Tax=Pseudomonas sp. NUPR-001 TaxID=3416058 RepID=UPI003F9A809C
MNDNVAVLNTALQKPDMTKVLAAASAYAAFWEKNTFEFLPLLHTSIERHYKGFVKYFDDFSKLAGDLATSIKSERVEESLSALQGAAIDQDERDFYFEEVQRAAGVIGKKLDVLLVSVEDSTTSIASLPVYDVERDRVNYAQTHERLNNALQLLDSTLASKRNELAELEKAIAVLEANGIESQFEGQLPSVEQIQGLVTQGATTAGAAIAIEQALEAVNKILGGLQDGLRYSQLQDQRRALQAHVQDMVVQQREQQQLERQARSNIEALEAYLPLVAMRAEWLAEKSKIYIQIKNERNKLGAISLNDVEHVQALIRLLLGLVEYAQHIVSVYREAF